MDFTSFGASPNDFLTYWVAVKAYFFGLNPYSSEVLSEVFYRELGLNHTPTPLYAFPWIFILLSWIALIPGEYVVSVWLAFSIAVFALAIYLLCDYLVQSFDCLRGKFWELFALVSVCSFFSLPTLIHLYLGHISFIVFLSVVLYLAFDSTRKREGDFPKVLLLLMTMLKPNLVFLFLLNEACDALVLKRVRFLAYGLLSLVMVAILPEMLQRGIWHQFSQSFFGNSSRFFCPTLSSWLFHFGIPGILSTSVPICLGFVGFFIVRSRLSGHNEMLRSWTILLSILATPYLWTYDFVLLLVPTWFSIAALSRGRNLVRYAMLFVAVGSTLFLEFRPMQFNVWYPWFVLGLLWIATSKLLVVPSAESSLI